MRYYKRLALDFDFIVQWSKCLLTCEATFNGSAQVTRMNFELELYSFEAQHERMKNDDI